MPLTYDVPHHPASPLAVRQFLRDALLPAVTQRLEEQGIGTFYYGNFNRDYTQWETYGDEPRYSIEYMGMLRPIGDTGRVVCLRFVRRADRRQPRIRASMPRLPGASRRRDPHAAGELRCARRIRQRTVAMGQPCHCKRK